jgi:hypothetical protein
MASTLFLLALLAYMACEADDVQGWRARALALGYVIAGVASMLCKEQGVTVFGVCCVYDALRCLWLTMRHVAARLPKVRPPPPPPPGPLPMWTSPG